MCLFHNQFLHIIETCLKYVLFEKNIFFSKNGLVLSIIVCLKSCLNKPKAGVLNMGVMSPRRGRQKFQGGRQFILQFKKMLT